MAAPGRRRSLRSRGGRKEHHMTGTSRIDRRGFLRNAGSAALGAAAAGSIAQLTPSALAQEKFPARDVNWIIYQAPGGSIDTTARIIQPYLEKHGVKTSLDYVLGAGGRVARTKLYTARSDGYVMMTESAPGAAIDEVIGRAGSSHIQLAALQKELNLPFGMVHFEGSGKAYPAVMGGHVDAAISGPGSGSRMRESLHFLAITGEEREKALPDVPTLTELGFRVTPIDQIWYAMATPKVPGDRIATLSSAFAKAFEDKMLWEQMQKAGEYLKLLTRAQVEDMVAKQTEVIEKYKDVLG